MVARRSVRMEYKNSLLLSLRSTRRHPLFIYPDQLRSSVHKACAVLRSGEKVASHQKIAERPGLGHDEAQHEGGVDAEEVDGVALGRCVATQREDHLRGVQADVRGAKGIQVPTGVQGGPPATHAREREETDTQCRGGAVSLSLTLSLTRALSYYVTRLPRARRGRARGRSKRRGSSG